MMTNEMKLLTALCDALGFDVEEVCVNQDEYDKYISDMRDAYANAGIFAYVIDLGIKPIYEYKLTKSGRIFGGIPLNTVSDKDRLRSEKIGMTCDPSEFESIFGIKLEGFLSSKEKELDSNE